MGSAGDIFASTENDYVTEYVENKFRYTENSSSGYRNQAAYIIKYKDDLEELTKSSCTQLIAMKGELLYLNRIYEAKKYVVGLGNKFSISGFVEENKFCIGSSKRQAHQGNVKNEKNIDSVEVELNKQLKK